MNAHYLVTLDRWLILQRHCLNSFLSPRPSFISVLPPLPLPLHLFLVSSPSSSLSLSTPLPVSAPLVPLSPSVAPSVPAGNRIKRNISFAASPVCRVTLARLERFISWDGFNVVCEAMRHRRRKRLLCRYLHRRSAAACVLVGPVWWRRITDGKTDGLQGGGITATARLFCGDS